MMGKSVENSKLLDKFFEIGLEHKFLDQTPYELLTWDDWEEGVYCKRG